MNAVAEGAVAQGMILASLVGGFALAVIGQLVAASAACAADATLPFSAAVRSSEMTLLVLEGSTTRTFGNLSRRYAMTVQTLAARFP